MIVASMNYILGARFFSMISCRTSSERIPDFRSVVSNDAAHAHQTVSVIALAVGTLLYSVVNRP